MLSQFAQYFGDLATVRRWLFAAAFLPKEMPGYWEAVTAFPNREKKILAILLLKSPRH